MSRRPASRCPLPARQLSWPPRRPVAARQRCPPASGADAAADGRGVLYCLDAYEAFHEAPHSGGGECLRPASGVRDGTAAYAVAHPALHTAVIQIALNATASDGTPLVATLPLRAPEPAVEDILRKGQEDGEFRDFDVAVVAGVVRSAVTHGMAMRQRDDPDADLTAYAEELVSLFDLGIRR